MNNTASAAVKPGDEAAGTKITYSVTNDSSGNPILKLYRDPVNVSNKANGMPYSLLDDVATVNASKNFGNATFNAATKTATLVKEKDQKSSTSDVFHQVCGYAAFKAEITVPALTEYKINFSYTVKYTRSLSSYASTGTVGFDFLYYGNTYDNPDAKDRSEEMAFCYRNDSANVQSTPAGYSIASDYSAVAYPSGTTSKTFTVTPPAANAAAIPAITMTNSTSQAKTYTAYFGFYSYSSSGSSYYNWYTNTVTMSDTLTVTAINAPAADKTSAEYDANGNAFKFTYDQDRAEVKSVSYKAADGEASDITSATAIDSDGNCRLTNGAGTYTFTFKIKDICGAVWNSGTNDQTDKTVTVTITPKQVAPPTVSQTEQTYNPSGNKFPVTGYDGTKMTVSGLTYNNGNLEAAGAGTYTVTFKPKEGYAWSSGGTGAKTVTLTVKAKTLSVSWTTNKTEIKKDAESFFVMLPGLASTVTAETKGFLSEVRYYPKDDCTVDEDNNITVSGGAVALNDLEKDKTYYAVVTSTADSNYTIDGNLYYLFSTNDNRTRVVLSLTESESTYDAKQKEITAKAVKAEDNEELTLSLQLEYYSGETKLAGAPTDAGEYKVVVLISGTDAEHYTASVTEFTYTIKKAEPKLDPHFVGTGLYAGGSLPALSAGSNGTAGTYAWDNPDEKLGSGERSYGYTFTPTDTKNYKTVQSTVKIAAAEAGVKSITAVFDFPEDLVVYDSMKPDELRQYLKVTGTKEDGSTQDNLTGYTFPQTSLTKGENVKLTVNYGTASCTVTIPKVTECVLAEIEAHCTPTKAVYTSTNINTLKQYLNVTGKNNDGSNYSGTINGSDCTLSGTLTAGTVTLTVTYRGITTTCTVTVEEVKLASISASFINSLEVEEITAKTSEEKLRELIKVIGTNNDGSAYGDITEYTFETVVEENVLKIYISYNGFNDELEKEVEPEPEEVTKTSVPKPELTDKVYTGKEIDILKGWRYSNAVTVTGNYETEVGDYVVTLTLNEPEKYEWKGSEGSSVIIPYKITQATLTGDWKGDGTLALVCGSIDAEELNGLDLFEYKYYDADGNEVAKEDLEKGLTYTVQATLKDAKNFTIDSEALERLTEPHEFRMSPEEQSVWGKMLTVFKDNLPIVLSVIAGFAVLLGLLIYFVHKRRQRADDYYDDDYDYEEDDDDEDDDDDYDDDY